MRVSEEIRLQLFSNAYVAAAGDLATACKAVNVTKRVGGLLLKRAQELGLIATRMRRIMGRYEVDLGEVIADLCRMRRGELPTMTRVWRDKAGKIKGKEEVYSPLRASDLLARIAGAFEDKSTGDVGLRLSMLLARAITEHEELRKQEIAEGRIPLGLKMVRARAEAMAPPIKELRAAIEAEATVVEPTVPAPTPADPTSPIPPSPTPSPKR